MSEIADIMRKDRCSWSEAKARASVPPVRSEPLLACPCCGSPAKLDEPVDAIVGERVVVCTGCRIRTYPGQEYRVVMAWNRRQSNIPPCVTGAASDMPCQEGRP
jgi:hypothetical protein